MIIQIDPEIIPYTKKFQGLCKKPYLGHPRGCPNFGVKETCPPNLPLINNIFDFDKELYLAYTEFEVGRYAERMRVKHPKLKTIGQWYNLRYCQPVARKEHKEEISSFLKNIDEMEITNSPEAYGVNVTELMKKIGVDLRWDEWPPTEHRLDNKTYIVSLIGYPK
jgi:hypothetical protein